MPSDQEDDDGNSGDEQTGDAIQPTDFADIIQTAQELQGLRRSLISNIDLSGYLAGVDQLQREAANFHEVRQTVNEVAEEVRATQHEVVEPIRELQHELNSATQPFLDVQADLQQLASAVQSARAFTQAYNQQRETVLEAIASFRNQIRKAVEQQLRLEKPWNYDPREPHPAAKTTAENWCTRFLNEFDEVENEYFEKISERVEDGLDDFQAEPERPYAAIHIFITMQDALLWWLCYQDDDITVDETNEIGLPKYGTQEKQDALRKHYQAYFGVEEDEPARISDFKWDCFWAHRHTIMHGDVYAHYDMNIATTALLFFALTAHSVLHVIQEYDESSEDIPSIIDEIEQAEHNIESNEVDPAEALGTFTALQQANGTDT